MIPFSLLCEIHCLAYVPRKMLRAVKLTASHYALHSNSIFFGFYLPGLKSAASTFITECKTIPKHLSRFIRPLLGPPIIAFNFTAGLYQDFKKCRNNTRSAVRVQAKSNTILINEMNHNPRLVLVFKKAIKNI